MIAWVKAHAELPRPGTSAAAVRQMRADACAPRPRRGWKARRITRSTLVSTAGVDCSKANVAIAPAV